MQVNLEFREALLSQCLDQEVNQVSLALQECLEKREKEDFLVSQALLAYQAW